MDNTKNVTRYADSDLAEFKALLEGKFEKATKEYESLLEQIRELGEKADAEKSDMFDNSASQSETEMLQRMAHRTKKHVQNLQNALTRIRNKTYGICFKSGNLIDKRRLMAVPTTTQSLEAKTAPPPRPVIRERPAPTPKPKAKAKPKAKTKTEPKAKAKKPAAKKTKKAAPKKGK